MQTSINHASQLTNMPERSVTELSIAIKSTIEQNFGYVRVRGELSRVTIAKSGHLYTNLKDDSATLDAVCWRGSLARLGIKPQEGLEVVCTGRLTTYPGRSNYQLVIEQMEPAGIGAILKMLADLKAKLAAEGLFDAQNKRSLPFLPRIIGVVTSPTGAVIRDILHRLEGRFPCKVLVWPVAVQGQNAAAEVARGIKGFNAMQGAGRPDVIIVARGGGSFEDLMPFNDEALVRTAHASTIPLISAVGHETDTTLLDYVADQRAPTPTAAAELAVPVRDQLRAQLYDDVGRLVRALDRRFEQVNARLEALSAPLVNPMRMLDVPAQRLDRADMMLTHTLSNMLSNADAKLVRMSSRLRTPADVLASANLNVAHADQRLRAAATRLFDTPQNKLDNLERMLESLSFKKVLSRGYAVVRAPDGTVLTSAKALKGGDAILMDMQDGSLRATIDSQS